MSPTLGHERSSPPHPRRIFFSYNLPQRRHMSEAGEPAAKGGSHSPPSLPPAGRKANLHQAKSPPEPLALMLGHVAVDRPVTMPPSRCSGR